MNAKDKEDAVTLQILSAIEEKSDVSQRHIAATLDVALGLTNSYLKRCIIKGLVKIKQAPANRYFYYLTPKGLAEKSRLTAAYLSLSFEFYRRASASCSAVFQECAERGHTKVLLCGVSELAEIASLRAQEYGVVIVGTYDPLSTRERFLDKPVIRDLKIVRDFDACVVTALENRQALQDSLALRCANAKVLIPDILRSRPFAKGRYDRTGRVPAPPSSGREMEEVVPSAAETVLR